MDELLSTVIAQVESAGGSLTYAQILEGKEHKERQLLPRVLKQARANNQLTQTVELVDGKIVHTYHKVVS